MNDHKNRVGNVFDRAAPQYGGKSCSFFNYFGKRLVDQVDISVNQCVLDVATGRGAVLFPLAQTIGPLGQVIGIDISKQMLHETELEAKKRDLTWVHLQYMDAEHLDFPDNFFDSVFCGFGLFFFPSLPTALSEFNRVLKPGGKLGVSIWGKNSELDAWINGETKKLCNKSGLATVSLQSEHALRASLNTAQFKNIQIIEETKTFFYDTPEEWWNSLWTHGRRAILEQLSPEQITGLCEQAIKTAQNLVTDGGVPEELQVFYGVAQKREI
ncbi:MAG: methyltransferase domain-containing protein [Simkania sp.]|nr:methyltransferase domain-containing protein [Simkania sp.]